MSSTGKKILIDINHPAHVHFFKNPICSLLQAGHEVLVTGREREFVPELLAALVRQHPGLQQRILSRQGHAGMLSLVTELFVRDMRLTRLVRQFRPHVMAAIGGTFIAHAGFLTRTRSLVFYDTEIAGLQNRITYPFCSRLYVPDCYSGRVPERKTSRYRGYHELSYLHPSVFSPRREIAIENGLQQGARNYFIRLVAWSANHDIGYAGLTTSSLRQLIRQLSASGQVIISSEKPLPAEFSNYQYRGDINAVHHLLAFSDLYLGESATMASEAAVLGVPAIYLADSYRGYVNDIETRYGLITRVIGNDVQQHVDRLLAAGRRHWQQQQQKLLDECIDVSAYVVREILES